MNEWALVDTNILLLLVVGRAGPSHIDMHKRLRDHYTIEDFNRVQLVVQKFAGIVVVPQVLAEVNNLARQIREPARGIVQDAFRIITQSAVETWVKSADAVQSPGFRLFGLTDAILLLLCANDSDERQITLITADQPLAYRAQSLGYSVLNYREL